MRRRVDRTSGAGAIRIGCAALAAGWLLGCAQSSETARTPLTPGDFVRSPGAPSAPAGAAPQGGEVAVVPSSAPRIESQRPPERRGVVEMTGGIDDVRALVGPPPPSAPATPPTGESSGAAAEPGVVATERARGEAPADLVESLVGQINGRPIFASTFFAPMDARLRAEARAAKSVDEWFLRKGGAREQIRAAMLDTMRDELLLAEFEASLTPEQKLGVVAFVEDLRENLASLAEGSKELAQKRLLESEGVTFEEKVKMERDRELIRAQIGRALGDRAIVAWREVVQTYERDFDEFNPAPVAKLRVIQVPLRDPARVERVTAAVASGEDWAEIARRDSASNAVGGGLREVTLSREGLTKTVFFSGEPLNAAVQALAPGEQAVVDFAESRFWIRLESIDQPAAKTLYDAQLEIHNALMSRRLSEEEARYFTRLAARTSASDLNEMVRRLERLAIERYFPGIVLDQPARPASRPAEAPAPAPPPGG